MTEEEERLAEGLREIGRRCPGRPREMASALLKEAFVSAVPESKPEFNLPDAVELILDTQRVILFALSTHAKTVCGDKHDPTTVENLLARAEQIAWWLDNRGMTKFVRK